MEPPSRRSYESLAIAYDERMAAAYLTLQVILRAETFDRLAGAVEDAIRIAPHLPWEPAAKLLTDKHNRHCVLDAIELAHERAHHDLYS